MKTHDLEVEYRAVVEEILELRGADERVFAFVRAVREPAHRRHGWPSLDLTFEQKVELLETVDVVERLELASATAAGATRRVAGAAADSRRSSSPAHQKQQREYFLRKQLESIQKELGEDAGSVVEEYRQKIAECGMLDDVREQAERELGWLERMGDASGEVDDPHVLDWLLAVPWASARRASIPSTRGCSTPTTLGSKTSRTGSSSTSRFASSARSAVSPRTSGPAPS